MNILVLGPQGSGKGTQAKRIKAMYGIPHIATGDIIREMMARDTELGQQLREVYDRGDLVSDEQMVELILSMGRQTRVLIGQSKRSFEEPYLLMQDAVRERREGDLLLWR